MDCYKLNENRVISKPHCINIISYKDILYTFSVLYIFRLSDVKIHFTYKNVLNYMHLFALQQDSTNIINRQIIVQRSPDNQLAIKRTRRSRVAIKLGKIASL